MHKIDHGHKSLDRIARTYGQIELENANEAETRLKVIDEILIEVLGWHKDDMRVEVRVSEDGTTTFADYVLTTAATSVLVEAKKAGASFCLPTKRRTLLLGGVLSNGAVGEAIRQARDYCRKRSIPFAVATNGSAWIVFAAVRTDGVEFAQTKAHIFRDLDDVAGRFVEFWELLSRERVVDGNLANTLLGRGVSETAERSMRQLLRDPTFRLGRNDLYEHLQPAIAVALSDEALLEDDDALENCYVRTSERLKYDQRLRVHLKDRLGSLGHPTTRVRTRKGAKKLDATLAKATTGGPLRFIVLLGPVGAGKTTFLRHTRRVSASSVIDEKVMWFDVDFKRATTADDPREFIYRRLLKDLEDDKTFKLGDWEDSIRPAYGEEIDRLRRGSLHPLWKSDPDKFEVEMSRRIHSDREKLEPYVVQVLSFAAKSRPGYLIIDNVDQLDDPRLQASIFVEVQAIARNLGFSAIIALRDSTYRQHKDSPTFDAFQFDSFYIDPPSVLAVLSRRFRYARHVLSGRSATVTTGKGITIDVPDLSVFFEIVSASILDRDSGQMIEALAGGNIRRGLDLVRNFLASGHTNADRALSAYLTKGNYSFPPHEVLRGAVLGTSMHFDERTAALPNIYDAKLRSPGLQLLRFRIVDYLVDKASKGEPEGERVGDLSALTGRLGVAQDDLLETLGALTHKGLLRTTDGLRATIDSVVVPTRLAAFVLRVLCHQFAYTEFCAMDAAIFDDEVWEELRVLTYDVDQTSGLASKIKIRRKRIRVFLDYCQRADERWSVECRRRKLGGLWEEVRLERQIRSFVEADMDKAVSSAARLYGRVTREDAERARSTGRETVEGVIVRSWPDKDYVFIREDDGAVDWFAHRMDFLTTGDWDKRGVGCACLFLRGARRGKPRAIAVRMLVVS